MWMQKKLAVMPQAEQALPGRSTAMPVSELHYLLGTRITPPFPQGMELALFGMGCFWGVEKLFWSLPGVYSTAAGYAGGFTPNPTYEEVCTGRTGHNEVVRVVFDPHRVSYDDLLRVVWESHDPTQGMQQGNDLGTQYRSGIYVSGDDQRQAALTSRAAFAQALAKAGYGAITTEIIDAPPFYYAEDYHQAYLAKNPDGYCPNHSCGIPYKSPVSAAASKA
jgi:peptide-methionine (S)-S-oxide reductase